MTKSLSAMLSILTLLALKVSAAPDAAPPVTLHVGDAAPALKVDKWLKGEPIKAFEPGKIYVIECWATW